MSNNIHRIQSHTRIHHTHKRIYIKDAQKQIGVVSHCKIMEKKGEVV